MANDDATMIYRPMGGKIDWAVENKIKNTRHRILMIVLTNQMIDKPMGGKIGRAVEHFVALRTPVLHMHDH